MRESPARCGRLGRSGKILAQDYNRGFGIIRHNIPKVAANNSFGILQNLISDNKATVFTKLLFVAGK